MQEQSCLDAEFTVSELRNIIDGMKNKSAPGVFGIDIEAIKLILHNDILADMV